MSIMSKRYGVGAIAPCGECGEMIALRHVPAADGELWTHIGSDLPFCYRDPQHTQTAWPDPVPTDVLGWIVQCSVCPARAMVDAQVDDWVCPRCAEVAAPVPECRLHQITQCPFCDHHDPLLWHVPSGDDVVDGWITCSERHPVTGYYCGLPEGHTADHMTGTMTWPRRASMAPTDEPCASSHPVVRDHLCGRPFGHTGDHSTHVMYWPNHSAPAPDDDADYLAPAKIQG